MLEARVNQQDTFDIRKGLRLFLIRPSVEPNCACQQAFPLIQKSNVIVFDHSMFRSGMEFFVSSVEALTHAMKREPNLASF